MDLISRENLQNSIEKALDNANLSEYEACACVCEIYDKEIENAQTMPLPDFKEGYKQAIIDGKTNFSSMQNKWGNWIISEIRCPNCLEYFDTDCYSMGELKKCPVCDAKLIGEEENE